jgi:hypothetical protein
MSSWVKFHANVIGWEGAILKKDVAVCGGLVIVSPPAGTESGMEDVAEAEELDAGADVDWDWDWDWD